MDFDPSTAVPVESFDPSTAQPIEASLANEATQHLAAYQAGELGNLSPKEVYLSNLAAQEGKPWTQRFIDKLTGGDWGKAYENVKSGISDTFSKVGSEIGDAKDDLASGNLKDAYTKAATAGRNTFGGAVKGVATLAPLAVDLAGDAVEGTIGQAAGAIYPPAEQSLDAAVNTATGTVSHYANAGTNALTDTIGVNRESPEYKIAENVAPLVVPIGGAEAGAGMAEKAANAIVDNVPRGIANVESKVLGGIADSKALPMAVKTGTGAAISTALGHNPLWGIGGALLTGRHGAVSDAITEMIQRPLSSLAEDARVVASAPDGMNRVEALSNAAREGAEKAKSAAESIRSTLSEGDAKILDDALQNDELADTLKGKTQDAYSKYQKSEQLFQKSNILEKNKAFSQFQQDAAKMLLTRGIQGTEGAAIGGALAGSSSPPGDTDAVPQGMIAGAAAVLPSLGLGIPNDVRTLNRNAARRTLIENSGLNSDHPLYDQHTSALDNQPQPVQDYINAHSGLAKANGANVVALSSPDLVEALKSEGQNVDPNNTPAGYYSPENKTAYVNVDKINQGPLPHEITHALDQASGLGQTGTRYGDALDELVNSKDPKVQKEIQDSKNYYEGLLNQNLAEGEAPVKLDNEGLKSEITAALGADLIGSHTPEGLYGGKSLLQNLESKIKGLFPQSPTSQFNFPVTKEMRSALEEELFKAGAKAKQAQNIQPATTTLPDNKNVTTVSLDNENTDIGASQEPVSPPQNLSDLRLDPDAVKKLKKQGFTDDVIAKMEPNPKNLSEVQSPTAQYATTKDDPSLEGLTIGKSEALNQSPPDSPSSAASLEIPSSPSPEDTQGATDVKPDLHAIRLAAEEAKRTELAGTKRKTKDQEIQKAGLMAMAKAHSEGNFMPSTGEPYEFDYIRGKNKAPNMGERFGQHIEPAGRYINEFTGDKSTLSPDLVHGRAKFQNPLVLDSGGGYGEPSNWKQVLSNKFGGKTGKALSRAVIKAGHDGIITQDKYGTSEIVDLRNFGNPGINNTSFQPSIDKVTHHKDRFGKESIYGSKLDPSDPFHQHLISLAGLTPKQVDTINKFTENKGNVVGIENYSHAVKEDEPTAVSRKKEQALNPAQERADETGKSQNAPLNIIPSSVSFNTPSNKFTLHGFNVDKFFANAKKLLERPETGASKVYDGVNDPQWIKDIQAYRENNNNGYSGDGRKKLTGTEATPIEVNEDYKPQIIPTDRFQVLNAAFGQPAPKGKTGKGLDTLQLGKQNAAFVFPDSGEFNQVRNKMGADAKLLESTSETLRPENIRGEIGLPVADEHLLRPSGVKPEQLQSFGKPPRADFVSGGFQPSISDLGFYSKLEQVAEDKLPNKASAGQILATLKSNGVKPDEMKWTGLDDFLRENPNPTKAQLLQHIRENNVQIHEVVKGGDGEDFEKAYRRHIQELVAEARKDPSNDDIDYSNLKRQIEAQNPQDDFDFNEGRDASSETKFSQYVTPGGEPGSYREALLTLPKSTEAKELLRSSVADEAKNLAETSGENWEGLGPNGRQTYMNLAERKMQKAQNDAQGIFKSSHFDEPNILAHVRYDARTGPNGEKIMHLSEIQSDWHQKGRKEGYATKEDIPPIRGNDKDGYWIDGPNGSHQFYSDTPQDVKDAFREHWGKSEGVPDAPFKTTWPALAFKRMLHKAASEGYDAVTWDNGETQAARYDLSKQVKSLQYRKNKNNTYSVSAQDNNGQGHLLDSEIKPDKLEDFVGKDVAQKIIGGKGQEVNLAANNEPADKWNRLSGLDLKVGGEGMKGFYDKILPSVANDIGKKFGARVGTTKLDSTDSGKRGKSVVAPNEKGNFNTEVHSLPITPEMRESVMTKGQPLFQPSTDPRAIKEAAIKINGKTYTGPMHFNAILDAQKGGVKNFSNLDRGWITNNGEYLSDEDAHKRAIETGQTTQAKLDAANKYYGNDALPGSKNKLESLSFNRAKKKSLKDLFLPGK